MAGRTVRRGRQSPLGMGEAAPALIGCELVLNRYRPLRPLGSGGSGSVWLARDERTGLDVALKIVAREGKSAARAEREAAAAAHLRHPACLRAYGFGARLASRLHRVRVRPRPDLSRGSARRRADGRHSDRGLRAGVRRPGPRPRSGNPAPRREAVERPSHRRRPDLGAGARLRARADGGGRDADRGRRRARDARVHLAGAARRKRGDPGRGRLGRRRDAVGGARGAASVLAWLDARDGTSDRGGCAAARRAPARSAEAGLAACRQHARERRPARRPTARELAEGLRGAFSLSSARPRPRFTLPPRIEAGNALTAVLAAILAGWTAAALPFYPHGWPYVLAILAAVTTLFRERAGIALALAVPVLPLGNISLGLALLYAALAAGWLLITWREPRAELLFVVGPLLAPLAALGLLPLAPPGSRSAPLRAPHRRLGVLTAALAAGIRHASLPLVGGPAPLGLGIAERATPSTSPARSPARPAHTRRCSSRPVRSHSSRSRCRTRRRGDAGPPPCSAPG